jgi:YD repeat-containing protein
VVEWTNKLGTMLGAFRDLRQRIIEERTEFNRFDDDFLDKDVATSLAAVPGNFRPVTRELGDLDDVRYVHDPAGCVIREQHFHPGDDASPYIDLASTYDSAGRRVSLKGEGDAGRVDETWRYDDHGNMVEHAVSHDGSLQLVTRVSYDAAGRRIAEEHRNAAGRLTGRRVFTYDSEGNVSMDQTDDLVEHRWTRNNYLYDVARSGCGADQRRDVRREPVAAAGVARPQTDRRDDDQTRSPIIEKPRLEPAVSLRRWAHLSTAFAATITTTVNNQGCPTRTQRSRPEHGALCTSAPAMPATSDASMMRTRAAATRMRVHAIATERWSTAISFVRNEHSC